MEIQPHWTANQLRESNRQRWLGSFVFYLYHCGYIGDRSLRSIGMVSKNTHEWVNSRISFMPVPNIDHRTMKFVITSWIVLIFDQKKNWSTIPASIEC